MTARILCIVLFLFMAGCGTTQFHPPIFPLAKTKIPDFPVAGKVSISNLQDSKDPTIIHSYLGKELQSNYHEITNTMVEQATLELERHGELSKNGKDKSIGLKVTYLNSTYIAWFWRGTMTYTVILGSGEQFEMTVKHGTGGGAYQDLSGSIADGVVALFKDERVQKYLSQQIDG